MSERLLRSDLVTDAGAFTDLEQPWWDLWRRSAAATPFQTPAWLLPWWRRFAPGDLCTIAVWRGRRLVGLAPFYLDTGAAAGRRLLPVGISLSDYLDVLVDPACGGPVASAIVDRAVLLAWDAWELEELGPGAAALDLPRRGASCALAEQSACPVLDLSGGGDLAACVPARRRRQLRRARAAAGLRGATSVETVADATRFVEELARLHGARWASRGGAGVLRDEAALAFHREALQRLGAAGLARCWLLRIGGDVAAAYYGMATRGRAYAYLGGFDPRFADESPGSILIGHAIAEALREGATEFHFLRGREAYKYSWGASDRWNRRLTFRRGAP